MTCLLCVNSHGIYVRELDSSFEVQDSIMWTDIKNIICKQKKLNIHKHDGQINEITCLNSKMARVAGIHLRRYLEFKGSIVIHEPTSWFGRLSQQIRKSFSRRPTLRPSINQLPDSTEYKKPTSIKPVPSHSLAPSTIPESSFISEDVMENPVSMVEPSLKTNSTYDVSLGSDNSYRPTITSLSIEELSHNPDKLSSFQKSSFQHPADDYVSLKTTSTYEVSLDSRQLVRPMSSDNDSSNTGQTQLSSFGNNSTRVSPPLSQAKKDIVPIEVDKNWSRSLIIKPEEPILNKIKEPITVTLSEKPIEMEIKSNSNFKQLNDQVLEASNSFVPTPIAMSTLESPLNKVPPELPKHAFSEVGSIKIAPEPPVRTISEQSNTEIQFKNDRELADKAQPPIPPIRAIVTTSEINNKKLAMSIEPIKEEEPIIAISDPTTESNISKTNIPVSEAYSVTTTSVTNEIILPSENSKITMYLPTILSENFIPSTDSFARESPVTPIENRSEYIQAQEKENFSSENLDFETNDQSENLIQTTSIVETKLESKLPISKQRSIPSPKIQRPSRVSVKELPSPKEERREFVSGIPVNIANSPSDKENYQNNKDKLRHEQIDDNVDDNLIQKPDIEKLSSNFSRFEGQEYKVDSKTTFTSVTTVGDSIVKKSTQTEISSVKSTGIPTPKQYKSTTTITTTVKKPADISKSPSISATKIPTGIPRMSSK